MEKDVVVIDEASDGEEQHQQPAQRAPEPSAPPAPVDPQWSAHVGSSVNPVLIEDDQEDEDDDLILESHTVPTPAALSTEAWQSLSAPAHCVRVLLTYFAHHRLHFLAFARGVFACSHVQLPHVPLHALAIQLHRLMVAYYHSLPAHARPIQRHAPLVPNPNTPPPLTHAAGAPAALPSFTAVSVREVGAKDFMAIIKHFQMQNDEGDLAPTPPEMTCALYPHQQAGVAWMVQCENGKNKGGILADEQGLGKTAQVVALILANSPRCPKEKSGSAKRPNEHGPASGSAPKRQKTNRHESAEGEGQGEGEGEGEESQGEGPTEAQAKVPVGNQSAEAGDPKRVRATLVVCPLSVLHQWECEIISFTKAGTLTPFLYHGTQRTQRDRLDAMLEHDVVLTTYATVANELYGKRRKVPGPRNLAGVAQSDPDEGDEGDAGEDNEQRPRDKKRAEISGRGPLFQHRWFRVVLDEGHFIKNGNTLTAKACHALSGERRWILSGTPVQNSIKDLLSVFQFLRLNPYSNPSSFRTLLNDREFFKTFLFSVMKRRTKGSKVRGRPVIELPPKEVSVVYVEFDDKEKEFYERLAQQARASVFLNNHSAHHPPQPQQAGGVDGGQAGAPEEVVAAAGSGSDQGMVGQYSNVLSCMMRLRLACNHPCLAERAPDLKSPRGGAKGEQRVARASVPEEVVLAAEEVDSLESTACQLCARTEAECGGALLVVSCGHVFCRECSRERVSCELCFQPLAQGDDGIVSGWPLQQLQASRARALASGSSDGALGADLGVECLPETEASSKISALVSLLEQEMASPDPRKTLVFSQWVRTLDLVRSFLAALAFPVFQIDGKVPAKQRASQIRQFREQDGFCVLLVSLHTGSLGLNLTCASNVVLLDSWWNSAVEAQAIDRVHRIGQRRHVTVRKLVVKDSIEDRVMKVQQRKMDEIEAAYDVAALSSRISRFSADDLRLLLGSG